MDAVWLTCEASISLQTSQVCLECVVLGLYWPIKLYNFQQWISWFSHRWRTQRNAISNVNCRIQWIIESLNAPCALGYSQEHACLSVMNPSLAIFAERQLDSGADVGVCLVIRKARLKESSWCTWILGLGDDLFISLGLAQAQPSLWYHPMESLCDGYEPLEWQHRIVHADPIVEPLRICLYEQLFSIHLASNQVGLPAELKHINKRRKRN